MTKEELLTTLAKIHTALDLGEICEIALKIANSEPITWKEFIEYDKKSCRLVGRAMTENVPVYDDILKISAYASSLICDTNYTRHR